MFAANLWHLLPDQKELDAHLAKLEEIKRRDHRNSGKNFDLITIQDEIGPGLVLWHPKGSLIRLLIENFWREQHIKDGYDLVIRLTSPGWICGNSGHVDYYRENMFASHEAGGQRVPAQADELPFHIADLQIALARSYRDLPIRYGELGTVLSL